MSLPFSLVSIKFEGDNDDEHWNGMFDHERLIDRSVSYVEVTTTCSQNETASDERTTRNCCRRRWWRVILYTSNSPDDGWVFDMPPMPQSWLLARNTRLDESSLGYSRFTTADGTLTGKRGFNNVWIYPWLIFWVFGNLPGRSLAFQCSHSRRMTTTTPRKVTFKGLGHERLDHDDCMVTSRWRCCRFGNGITQSSTSINV
jgi:hypothetical protein